MKEKSLVIVNQHVTVNTVSIVVQTARQALVGDLFEDLYNNFRVNI